MAKRSEGAAVAEAPTRDSVQAAMEAHERRLAASIQSEANERAEAWRQYAALLSRSASPERGDADRLLLLARDLGIAPGAMAADAEALRRGHELVELTDARDKLNAEASAAGQRAREVEARARAEMEAATLAYRHAAARASQAGNAAFELTQLARRHPDLFDQTADPPVPLA